MVVDVEEHLLVLQASCLHEGALELGQLILTGRRGWVENKNDSVGALLDRTPALLVAPIARDVPELNVHLAEDAGGSGCILLELNDPTSNIIVSIAGQEGTYLTPTVGL